MAAPSRSAGAARARSELARLSHTPLPRSVFIGRAAETLARAVPFDGGCWHTVEEARDASETFRTQSQQRSHDASGATVATERYEIVDVFLR